VTLNVGLYFGSVSSLRQMQIFCDNVNVRSTIIYFITSTKIQNSIFLFFLFVVECD